MGLRYLETSALVKLYIQEAGTRSIIEMAHPSAGHLLAVLALSRVECVSAIRRRLREGDIEQTSADAAEWQLDRHLASRFLVQPVTDQVLDEAVRLLRRYPLRGFDALQLAGFLILAAAAQFHPSDPAIFVCGDERLLAAGRGEGIAVMNPAESA